MALCAGPLIAQTPSLSVSLCPAVAVPLGEWSSSLLAVGGGGGISVQYAFSGKVQPFLRMDIGYTLNPLQAETSLSTVDAAVGGGLLLWAVPRLAFEAYGLAGYYQGILNDGSGSGGLATLRAGLGASFLLSSLLDLGVRVGYRADLGLAHLLEASVFASLYLSGRQDRQRILDESRPSTPGLLPPIPGRGLRIDKLELAEVFPVFHTYYDNHAIGALTLTNLESTAITGARLALNVPQFMEAPKEAVLPESLEPGKSITIQLNALFTEQILNVTEATKVAAELTLEYTMDGKRYGETTTHTLRLFDRNATIWDDDRRAAAFVTAKDPAILAFAKNVAGVARSAGSDAIDRNLVTAMGLFAAMDLAGINYVVDPKTPFSEFSRSATSIDFLQFPRQTLEYRGGDCDDLSILYAAMLESSGVETAFITIPGHIYVAFRLGLSAADAAKLQASFQECVVREDRVWVPVEVTLRGEGFMRAWAKGAREWRDADASGAATLIPVHDAWKVYEPVALPGSGPAPALSNDAILASLRNEVAAYVEREMSTKLAEIQALMASSGSTPTLRNRLGVLYARYGLMEKAIAQFKAAIADHEYVPALVNLGNVQALRSDWPAAGAYYERAAKLRPKDPSVLLGRAKAYYGTGQYELARKMYADLAAVDAKLAEKFAYLGGGSAGTQERASEAGEAQGTVVWAE